MADRETNFISRWSRRKRDPRPEEEPEDEPAAEREKAAERSAAVPAASGDPSGPADPSDPSQMMVYHQPDPTQSGFNPNEEHALIAPSFAHLDSATPPPAACAASMAACTATVSSRPSSGMAP